MRTVLSWILVLGLTLAGCKHVVTEEDMRDTSRVEKRQAGDLSETRTTERIERKTKEETEVDPEVGKRALDVLDKGISRLLK